MVDRLGGFRRKTSKKLLKDRRSHGKVSSTNFFADFAVGSRVVLKMDSAVSRGVFHPKFYGHTAVVKGRRGSCYEVQILDGSVVKSFIVHPVHLRGVK